MEHARDSLRIGLVDPYVGGHHEGYAQILAKGLAAQGIRVCLVAPEETQRGLNEGPALERVVIPPVLDLGPKRHWKAFRRYGFAFERLVQWNATHVHFLYADWNMLAIWAATGRSAFAGQSIGTAHWEGGLGLGRAPNKLSSLKQWLHRAPTRRFAARGGAFVVHDSGLERALRGQVPFANVRTVPYPVFPLRCASGEAIQAYRSRLGIGAQCRVLLCFGDTRHDKGVDLAVAALACLPAKYHLLIAGRSLHFDAKAIKELAEGGGVADRVHHAEGYIPEDEVGTCFAASDVILLPYRRGFSGQSGPLTLGAALGKPVIGARLPVIGNTISQYSLGAVFEPEDIEGMVAAILHWKDNDSAARREDFQREHSCAAFASAMTQVYCDNYPSGERLARFPADGELARKEME